MFHISDVKKYVRCPKFFWLSKQDKQNHFIRYIRLDETVSDLVAYKLQIQNAFIGQMGDDPAKSVKALDQNEWLIKARFEYNNLRVKIPFMHKNELGWDIFFVNITPLPKDSDIQYYSDNIWVLQKLGLNITDIQIIHFNENYIRKEELDYDALFSISSTFYNAKGHPSKDVYASIMRNVRDLTNVLLEMEAIQELSIPLESERTNKCTRKTKCTYYDECFPNELIQEDDSILYLVSSQHKYQMALDGYTTLDNPNLEYIEGSKQQFAQIMAARNKGLFVDRLALKGWLNDKIISPVSFLDFEWDTYAIPPYFMMKPFDVLTFQYSLHILENEEVTHKEFIGIEDCRKQLVESLIQHMPKTGSIVAFNAEGAEKIRLQEMMFQFPEYTVELQSMIDRMVDLSFPFNLGMVYDLRMRGLYSLKQILPIVDSSLNYKDLDISHGMEAVFNWRMLDRKENIEEVEAITKQLLEYCAMDTFALMKLYNWLKKESERGYNACQM